MAVWGKMTLVDTKVEVKYWAKIEHMMKDRGCSHLARRCAVKPLFSWASFAEEDPFNESRMFLLNFGKEEKWKRQRLLN